MKKCTKKCSYKAKGEHWEQWHVMLDSRRLWYFVNGGDLNSDILPLSYIDLPLSSIAVLSDSLSSSSVAFSIRVRT